MSKMRALILPDLIEIGHINAGRWKHIADTYVRLGLIDADYSLEGFIYETDSDEGYYWLYALFGGLVGISIVAVLACIWNRQLRVAVDLRTRERKDVEEELRQQKKVLGAVLDNAVVQIWAFDGEKYTYINKAYYEFTGISPSGQLSIEKWIDAVHPDDLALSGEIWSDAWEKKIEHDNYFRLRNASGGYRDFWCHGTPVFGEKGEFEYFQGFNVDITASKQAEARTRELRERLTNAERRESMGILAGGVAHDLNNILGPIVLLPEIVGELLDDIGTENGKDVSEAKEYLAFIESATKRAAAVVKDLQAIGSSGRVSLQPLDVKQMLQDCLCTHDINAIRRDHPDVGIDCGFSDKILTIAGDATDLHRVLLNLVINATEAIEGEGQVQVEAEFASLSEQKLGYETIEPGNYVVIHIRDTGEGVSDDFLKKMFEPFVTTKKKSSGKSGSGLGLSVVHSVIKAHNGYIDVERDSGKWSTTFSLYFPATTEKIPQHVKKKNDSLPQGTGHVLIVDDEPGQRFIAKRCLSRLGYTVTEVKNGHEALNLFNKIKNGDTNLKSIDIVVLDMIMEEKFDGLDTLEAILKLHPEQKVIIASGHAEGARVKAAEKLGACWLSKPYERNDLAEAVRERLRTLR